MKKISFITLAIALIFAVIVVITPTEAAVTNSSVAYLMKNSTVSVGPATSTRVFISKNFCANRVISTKGQAIMIGFNASSTATDGFWQAASTTVSYPSNQYGCGNVNVYGLVASTTINIAEFLY